MTNQTVFDIAKQIPAKHYIVSIANIGDITRKREIVLCRQIASWMIKKYYGNKISLRVIGNEIGEKNHATVLHACKTINNLMDTDSKFNGLVNEMYNEFKRQMYKLENGIWRENKIIELFGKFRKIIEKRMIKRQIEWQQGIDEVHDKLMSMITMKCE